MKRKLLAVFLACFMLASVFTLPAGAVSAQTGERFAKFSDAVVNKAYDVLESAVWVLLRGLNRIIPGYDSDWPDENDYESKNFYPGEEKFDTEVSDGARWRLGFSETSLIDGLDIKNGEFFLAGGLEFFKGRVPADVIDDQRVRAFALSDSTGGTVVQAVIDGFGISRGSVNEIRSRIEDFAAENGIISVNVSVLHQHSCIDTLGFNVPLIPALVFNSANSLFGGLMEKLKVCNSPVFMENLYEKTCACIKNAVSSMESGELYYGEADIGEYIHDKREPENYDEMIHRLRFVPDSEGRETWLLEAGIHPVCLSASTEYLTGDYPYYIEKTVNEKAGANVVFVQGAELALTTVKRKTDGSFEDKVSAMEDYGEAIADRVIAIKTEEKLEPVLNIRLNEVYIPVENQIHILAAREDLFDAVVVRSGRNYKIVTEIGYIELGNRVGIFLCPGEFEPGILYEGAVTTAQESRTGESWNYEPLSKLTGMKHVMVFGLCNDQSGYVLTDNDYRSLFTENEEVNVICKKAGSIYAKAYGELIESVR